MAAVVASGTSHTGYSLTVTKPNGTSETDLLVAFLAIDGDNSTFGAPGGWVDQGGATGYNRTTRVFTKVASGSEPGSYTFTSSSTNTYRACMVRITGAPTSGYVAQGLAWNGANSSTTSLVVPTRTAPTGGALQLAFPSWASSGVGTISGPVDWDTPHAVTNTDKNALIAWRTVPAGNTGATTFTVSGAGTMYNHAVGSMLISSGQVTTFSRSMAPSKSLVRSVVKSFAGSVTAAGAVVAQRVVVRLFTRTIGGSGLADDNFTDAFGDSFAVAGGTPATFGADLIRVPKKIFNGSIPIYGGYVNVTQKLLVAAIALTGTSRRTLIRTFVAALAPAAAIVATNVGRLFGSPGIVDITVRRAGEVRARIRRR